MVCPVCGASVEKGSRYCNNCGTAFRINNVARRKNAKKRRAIKAIKSALKCIIIFSLLALAFAVIKHIVLPPIYRYSYCNSKIFSVESAAINASMNDTLQDTIIKKDISYDNGYRAEVFTLVDLKNYSVTTFTEASLLDELDDSSVNTYIYDTGRQLQISFISFGTEFTLLYEKASFLDRVKALTIIQVFNAGKK